MDNSNKIEWYSRLKPKYPVVSDEEWALFDTISKERTIKKGNSFLDYGEVAVNAAFVISGKFAFTIMDEEGNERIIKFGFTDDFLANCESFYRHAPSKVGIIALEDAVVKVVKIKHLQPLYDLHMCIATVNLKIYQEDAEQTFEHQYILSLKSPARRYKFLMEKRPELIRRISLKYIAKYLYVSREAISRARLFLLKKT